MVKVKIYYVRHGMSCANVIKYYTSKYMMHHLLSDPVLADEGVVDSIKARKLFSKKNIDRVYSSCLLRAIETAHYMFEKEEVSVIPYVTETGLGFDNSVKSVKKQERDVKKITHVSDKVLNVPELRIDRTLMEIAASEGLKKIESSHYDKFIKFMESTVIPKLMMEKRKGTKKHTKIHATTTYKVAVVTHSSFVKKNFDVKLNNNGVLECDYNYVDGNLDLIKTNLLHEGNPVRDVKRGSIHKNKPKELNDLIQGKRSTDSIYSGRCD